MSSDKRTGSRGWVQAAGKWAGLARVSARASAALALGALAVGCAGSHDKAQAGTTAADKAKQQHTMSLATALDKQPTDVSCEANKPNYEVSEYDTSGDDTPDVRKVFLRLGEGVLARLVLVCRESDLNADGRKDVVRYYSDEGKPLREEADRNFDGKMDEVTFFQEGQILRQEFDTTHDGKVDTKIYFDAGKPLRAERDLKARSTVDHWQPDRWEYYEDGRVVRMGTDVDGDGKVDRWDRDMSIRRGPDLGDTAPGNSTTDGASDSGPA